MSEVRTRPQGNTTPLLIEHLDRRMRLSSPPVPRGALRECPNIYLVNATWRISTQTGMIYALRLFRFCPPVLCIRKADQRRPLVESSNDRPKTRGKLICGDTTI